MDGSLLDMEWEDTTMSIRDEISMIVHHHFYPSNKTGKCIDDLVDSIQSMLQTLSPPKQTFNHYTVAVEEGRTEENTIWFRKGYNKALKDYTKNIHNKIQEVVWKNEWY